MKMKRKASLVAGTCLIGAFILWTVLVGLVDVEAIGPRNSEVGFAALNGFVRDFVGVNMTLYVITDWLGLVPIAVAFGFAVLGLIQLIRRKSLFKVDRSILLLGAFYLAVIAVYIIFEFVVVNRRPVLIDGYLEASYPSSTTLLVLCVMPTAAMQLNERIINTVLRRCMICVIAAFTAFCVIGRIISGVHWITDVIGGILISSALINIYYALNNERYDM